MLKLRILRSKQCFQYDLMLFGARCQLSALGIQLGKVACDALHTGVQLAVLVILCIEVILVALSLVEGHQRCILTVRRKRKLSTSFFKVHDFYKSTES